MSAVLAAISKLGHALQKFAERPAVQTLELAEKENVSFTPSQLDVDFLRKYPSIAAALGSGAPNWSGEAVNEYTALNNGVVFACLRCISETLGALPTNLMVSDGTVREVATKHPLQAVLHSEPNPEMAAMNFKEALTAHCLLWGMAYARIVRRGSTGPCIGLWPVTPNAMRPDRDKDRNLVYLWKDGNSPEKTLQQSEVFVIPGLGFDGVRGYSVVSMARNSIGLGDVQSRYASQFFARGGRGPYILEKASLFKSATERDTFYENWRARHGTSDSFFNPLVLEGDIKYHDIGMPLDDAQLLASRQFSVQDICRWFRISPHKVGDLSRATFSNIEHLAIEFLQETLVPWLVRWEQAIYRCLLTRDEKLTYYAKFNVAGLLRGDFSSRMAGYATMLQNGVASINEIRELEDWNPIEGGDRHHIQLNMQTLPSGNQPMLVEVGGPKKPKGGA